MVLLYPEIRLMILFWEEGRDLTLEELTTLWERRFCLPATDMGLWLESLCELRAIMHVNGGFYRAVLTEEKYDRQLFAFYTGLR